MKKLSSILLTILTLSLLITSVPIYAAEGEFDFDQLKRDYARYYRDISPDDVEIVCDCGSYGTGRVVVLSVKGETITYEPYELYIGNLCFRFSSKYYADRFYLYRNGTYGWGFVNLPKAYENGLISSEGIYNAAVSYGVDTYSPEEVKVEENGLTWTFDPVIGKLTVEGEGNMPDYKLVGGRSMSPTSKWRYDIKTIDVNCSSPIGAYAFYNCENVTHIDLWSSVKDIGNNAFEGCSSITQIDIRSGTKKISSEAFKDCSSLVTVDTNGTVTEISSGAFKNCTSLKTLKFYTSVQYIKENAFEGCVSLTKFDFPESIREIGKDAFKGCTNLKSLKFFGKPPKEYSGIPKDYKGEILYPDDNIRWTDEIRSSISKTALWVPFDAPDIKRIENYFEDLSPKAWYLSAVQYCYGEKYLVGTGNYRFEPNKNLTREETAMLLYKYRGKGETYEEYRFKDVVPGAWYADAVEWMYRKGYSYGISVHEFGVGLNVTREDFITLIYNVHRERWETYEYCYDPKTIESFSDHNEISSYALQAMRFTTGVYYAYVGKWEDELDPIIYGNNGKIMPKATCTRAEAAAILMRSAYVYNKMDVFLPS